MKSDLILGDCLEVMKDIPDNSVDSIVTDPPYHLVSIVKRFGKEGSAPAKEGTDGSFKILSSGFMGKTWDGLGEDGIGIANNPLMWAECLRVLKPGGYLLSFGGTRTYHRMASAIEDAGFEVRDMIEWVYGSGFPKSLNIGKAVDKMGNRVKELHNFTKWFDELCIGKDLTNKQIDEFLGLESGGSTASHYRGWNTQQPRYPRENHYKRLKEWLGFGDVWDEKIAEVERELVGVQEKAMSGWNTDGSTKFIDRDITKGTSEWEGWGTALKPAHEPICMARKPLAEPTVAQNCLKWGCGGINIDESRVETDGTPRKGGATTNGNLGWKPSKEIYTNGRFPANLIHDNSEEVRECFPETKSAKAGVHKGSNGGWSVGLKMDTEGQTMEYGDSGNASRFFKSILYYPKASKSERNKGCEGLEEKQYSHDGREKEIENAFQRNKSVATNSHPTVKPIALMEYLIKIVTPKGGIVLDPFAGSGSTLIAAKQNGFKYIGIELTEEYIPIIKARLSSIRQQTLL